jgi:predicted RND superfamily exporter protein
MKRFVHILSAWILKYPKTLFLLSFVIVAISGPQMKNLIMGFGPTAWFHPDSFHMKQLDQLNKKFGNDEMLVVALHNEKGLFNKKTLAAIKDLNDNLELQPSVIRVDSLANFIHVTTEEDEIMTEPLFSDHEREDFDEAEIQRIREVVMSHEDLPGYMVNEEGTVTLVFARLKPIFDKTPDYKNIVASTKDMIEEFKKKNPQLKFYLLGDVSLKAALKNVAFKDTSLIIPLLFILIIIFFFLSFKNIAGIILPLGVIVFSNLLALGFAGFMEMKLVSISFIVPIILMAIGIADSVHILDTYYKFKKGGLENLEAIKATMYKNLMPTLLTSITTAIGFFSLMTADLVPLQDFGLISGIGVMAAWFFSHSLLVPALILFPSGEAKNLLPKSNWTPDKYITFIQRWRGTIITSFIIIIGIFIYFGLNNRINSNPYTNFKKGTELRNSNEFIINNMGGFAGPQIIINSGQENGINKYEFLHKVERLQNWLLAQEDITSVNSILNTVKQINRAFHQGNDDAYKIPKNNKSIAEQIFFYNLSVPPGKNLNDIMTIDQKSIRMSVLWTIQDSVNGVAFMDKIEAKAKELGLNIFITGKVALTQKMVSYVISIFLKSLSLSLVIITIILFLVFRSLKLGAISLIPNVVPIVFNFGVLAMIGQAVDFTTAIVSSVCLGIAVDDTIHFLMHYKDKTALGESPKKAMHDIFSKTAGSLILTTIILMVGFGSFLLADFNPNKNFGVLAATVLFVALVTDLLLLPAILIKKEK